MRTSVLIPTHNPRWDSLERVLDALHRQTLRQAEWEAIVIDNGSKPSVDAARCRRHLPDTIVVREERLGLAHARRAGIRQARGEILVWVDDDNVLSPDYLSVATRYLESNSQIGAVGGRIIGDFAVPPAPWAQPHLSSLALRDLGDEPLVSNHGGAVTTYDYFAPYGAGLVIRAAICSAFDRQADRRIHSIGRTGNHLGGCEDCEMIITAWRLGYECAYLPSLIVTHLIPAARLRFRYLQRLARQGQESWAEFLCRHGLAAAVPRWTVPLRQAKAFVTHRAWTRTGFIRWRATSGYFVGASRGAIASSGQSQ